MSDTYQSRVVDALHFYCTLKTAFAELVDYYHEGKPLGDWVSEADRMDTYREIQRAIEETRANLERMAS